MITLGEEHRLGRKAFYLLASRHVAVGLVFFMIGFALMIFSSSILGATAGVATVGGASQSEAMHTAASIVSYGILIVLGFGAVIGLVGLLVSWLEYSNYTYMLDEFGLVMRRGLLDKKEITLPYRQIQDVDIERTLGLQLMGLSKIVLMTAGTEEKDEHEMTQVILEPLDKAVAEEIKSMLERKIGVQVVEDESRADAEQKA